MLADSNYYFVHFDHVDQLFVKQQPLTVFEKNLSNKVNGLYPLIVLLSSKPFIALTLLIYHYENY